MLIVKDRNGYLKEFLCGGMNILWYNFVIFYNIYIFEASILALINETV